MTFGAMIPQKLFVNVYPPFAGQIGTAYATRELADQMAARGRLACIEVDVIKVSARLVDNDLSAIVEIETAK